MRIAVDVMGADHGSQVILAGVKMALEAYPHIHELIVVGNETEIKTGLDKLALRDSRLRIHHASEVLTMEDKPIEGLRRKKDCSILRAMELVKEGKADAAISPGNTGGLMAAATIKLRPLESVERAAIATVMPSLTGAFVMLDGGANAECKPLHLAQFAVMGNVYSREILGHKNPRVGILSNGTEEIKGNELTRESLKLCKQLNLNFIGYVEGHDLFEGHVDVVVTDGFIGNIVLKSCESLGKAVGTMLKRELKANPLRMAGALLAKGALDAIKMKLNPDAYGGAPLLGLNGNVIKAHGSAKEFAIQNAIRVACESVQHRIHQSIQQEVAAANTALAAVASV
jgi:glycerol-3-phosphate acyltransferase PlsX